MSGENSEKNEKGERQDRRILTNAPISDDIVKICSASYSVSSLLSAHPSMAAGEAWKKLYGTYTRTVGYAEINKAEEAAKDKEEKVVPEADLEKAARCGKWGDTKPSELFLKIYHDVLAVIEEDPSRAMVSPSLLGSYGTAPLTVISTIPDIVRHMANVIARADKEVFLATNYWQDSTASRYLTNAIRELDHRAGQRKARVVVKVIYDRGSPKQVLDPHFLVSEAEFTGKNVCLPARSDLPNTDLEVMNYHQPIVGTFHSKYMVVDRKIAILQSNNIQDNDNLEMMVHFEGPIVDSFYDMALLSWHKAMNPPLPTLGEPAAAGNTGLGPAITTTMSSPEGLSATPSNESATVHRTDTGASTASTATTSSQATGSSASSSGTASSEESAPKAPNLPNGPDAATKAFLDAGKQPTPQSAIQQPVPAGMSLLQSTSFRPQYDDDIAGEVTRVQASVTPKAGETKMEPITALLNHTTNRIVGDAPEFAPGEEMTPYIPYLENLAPFPIAMVNRPPYGTPNHSAVVMPQNAAWLSALRHARKNVFIQSPTLNAEPLVPAIRDACERGLDVICYICLGYNDTGELLPKQGGTNEMIAHQLYQSLSDEGKTHLHYFWYIGKDQTRPIPQRRKRRDCHIKLMIVDESIGIQGNGNQDTQSWYHSQEINVMLESPEICRAWIDGLRRNQNTHIYGTLDPKEGIWRDSDGKEAEFAMGIDPGRFSWAKGVMGAVQRVQGKGGF